MAYGPFAASETTRAWIEAGCAERGSAVPRHRRQATGQAVGVAAYLRIEPAVGVIEVGHIHYSPLPAADPGRDRGDVPDDAAGLRRARLPPLRVEVRRAQRAVARGGGRGWDSASRASSGRPRSTRAATATPPGTRSSTTNGRERKAAFEAWLDPANFDAATVGRSGRWRADRTEGGSVEEIMFVEMGMGVDLQGQDVTKAANRAVRDAIGRNYMPGIRTLLEDGSGRMLVHVRLGVPADAALSTRPWSAPPCRMARSRWSRARRPAGAQRARRRRPDLHRQCRHRGRDRDLAAELVPAAAPPPAAAS